MKISPSFSWSFIILLVALLVRKDDAFLFSYPKQSILLSWDDKAVPASKDTASQRAAQSDFTMMKRCMERSHVWALYGGFLDDLMNGNLFNGRNGKNGGDEEPNEENEVAGRDSGFSWNEEDFRSEIQSRAIRSTDTKSVSDPSSLDSKTEVALSEKNGVDGDSEFDGYALRDVIQDKWGVCYDVDFQPVTTFGFRELYLNVLPFRLGGKRFRHETEMDYLCHLQAVVEILEKYDQLDSILAQIEETKKKPRAGTSPLVAVPLRLDLSETELDSILQ